MALQTVQYRSRFGVSAAALFAFHHRDDALSVLMPPWERARVVSRTGGLAVGARTVIETRVLPGVWLRWVAVHDAFEEGTMFADRAERGPFAHWRHVHRVTAEGASESWLDDTITYALPLGFVADRVAGAWVRRRLDAMFRFRHEATARALGTAVIAGHGR